MNPFYYGTPRTVIATTTVGNTLLDGTGTLLSLVTGQTNGTPILGVEVKAATTNLAGLVNFFVTVGSVTSLVGQITCVATTIGSTTMSVRGTWVPPVQLTLASATTLKAAPHNDGERFNFMASAGDY